MPPIFGALEAGGTKMVCAAATAQGQILDRLTIPTRTPQETIPELLAFFRDKDLSALGVGSFGPLELDPRSPDYGVIQGCELLAPSVGGKMALATEYATQQTSLLSLMEALEEEGMLDQVDAIHLDDLSFIAMDYGGRFTVKLSYNADYAYKLKRLSLILEGDAIQENMTGTFDMRGEGGMDGFQQNVR